MDTKGVMIELPIRWGLNLGVISFPTRWIPLQLHRILNFHKRIVEMNKNEKYCYSSTHGDVFKEVGNSKIKGMKRKYPKQYI